MSSVTHRGPQLILKSMAASGTTKGDQQLVKDPEFTCFLPPLPDSFLASLAFLLTSHCTLTGWSPKSGPDLQPYPPITDSGHGQASLLLKELDLNSYFHSISSDTSPNPNQATKRCALSARLLTLLPSVPRSPQPGMPSPTPLTCEEFPLQSI